VAHVTIEPRSPLELGLHGDDYELLERRQVELVVTHPDQREEGGEEAHRGESPAHEAA
jgi:hypothetical protein